MRNRNITKKEYQFCLILWEHEPVTINELTVLCKDKFNWARTTTYTVIQRLSDKGILKKEDFVVTALLSKEQVQDERTEKLLKTTFGGHLAELIASIARLVSKYFPEAM